jgi:hypothetical protein
MVFFQKSASIDGTYTYSQTKGNKDMMEQQKLDINNFLYPLHRYRGQFTPEALLFNANLQEFATRVNYICNLQSRGKLSQQESYEQINALWEKMKSSYSGCKNQ